MRLITVCVASAAMLTAACQQPLPVERAPVSASVRAPADRLAKGTTEVVVRTYTTVENERVEVADAQCAITSDELSAKVVTPQAIVVPNFKQRAELPQRGLPSALVADCRLGNQRGRSQVTSQPKQIATATGGGLAAALIVTAVSVAAATSTPWVYPPQMSVTVE